MDLDQQEEHSLVAWVERSLGHTRADLKDDLIQTGHEAILKAKESYKPDKGASLKTWAAKYIRRDMIRLLAKESSSYQVDIDDLIHEDDVEELLDYRTPLYMESIVEVERLIERLDNPARDYLISHLYNDLNYAEIARENNVSRQYVAQTISTALEQLRAISS